MTTHDKSHPKHPVADPVPDPEPASPSLPHPDPGVFHHEPGSIKPKDDWEQPGPTGS